MEMIHASIFYGRLVMGNSNLVLGEFNKIGPS